jgi:putative ABC transport system substrate-binding protein
MQRREFITLLGGAAVTWPLATRAQQASKGPTIGFLHGSGSQETAAAFIEGLRDVGYIDGATSRVESRTYGTRLDRLSGLADELVRLQCNVILATSAYAIKATMNATSTIPIVGVDLESDPVANGWVKSLSRPGGNLTGVFLDIPELSGKQIELLKETVPTLDRLGVIWDSTIGSTQFRATEAAARAIGIELQSLPIQSSSDFNNAFDRAESKGVDGIVILSSPVVFGERVRIAELALKARLPTISLFTPFPRSGGLMAYGPNLSAMFKRAAFNVDRIIKGAKVEDIPIERPSRFDLVINLKTAKGLGLTVPPIVLARADEVIE